MYKPANIREFITNAKYKKVVSRNVNGRTIKEVTVIANLKGKFKLKGTTEVNANGVIVVNEKTTFITWWKADFSSADILEINNQEYQIIGTPENVEMRNRYAVLNLEKINGGA